MRMAWLVDLVRRMLGEPPAQERLLKHTLLVISTPCRNAPLIRQWCRCPEVLPGRQCRTAPRCDLDEVASAERTRNGSLGPATIRGRRVRHGVVPARPASRAAAGPYRAAALCDARDFTYH